MPLDVDRPPALADLIRRHRVEARLSQTAVATALGCRQMTVSAWECGQAVPNYRNFLGLVQLIGLDPILVGQAFGLMLAIDAANSNASPDGSELALTAASSGTGVPET